VKKKVHIRNKNGQGAKTTGMCETIDTDGVTFKPAIISGFSSK